MGWIFESKRCKMALMRISIDLDHELAAEVEKAVSLIGEKPATVLRLAIRAGLPIVTSRVRAPRPEGYFAADYPLPEDRLELERAMIKS
jgi:Arc/MetJ family transcription regulator